VCEQGQSLVTQALCLPFVAPGVSSERCYKYADITVNIAHRLLTPDKCAVTKPVFANCCSRLLS